MSDLNFFEPYSEIPEKTNYKRLILIVVVILALGFLVFYSATIVIDYSSITSKVSEANARLEDPVLKANIQRVNELQIELNELKAVKEPVMAAYTGYKQLHTVSRSLLEDYLWQPIMSQDTASTTVVAAAGEEAEKQMVGYGDRYTIANMANADGNKNNNAAELSDEEKEIRRALLNFHSLEVSNGSIVLMIGIQDAENMATYEQNVRNMVDANKQSAFAGPYVTLINEDQNKMGFDKYEGVINMNLNREITEETLSLINKER